MAAGFEPFALKNTVQFKDRVAANNLHDSFFEPSHGRNSIIMISPKRPSGTTVFSRTFMEAALPLVRHIYEMQVDHGNVAYEFKDLCVPSGSLSFGDTLSSFQECSSAGSDLFGAVGWNTSLLPPTGAGESMYGPGANDYASVLSNLDSMMVQVGINSTGLFRSLVGLQSSTSSFSDYRYWHPLSITVPFRLIDDRRQPGGGQLGGACGKWIKTVQSYVDSGEYANSGVLRVSFLSDQSIGDGLQDLLNAFIPFVFLVFAIMGMYAELFLSSQTRCKHGEATQMLLVIQGPVTSGMAAFSGMGWILYLGLEDIVIMCVMAVFLILAVGVDCTFILISAMKTAGPDKSIDEAMGHMLSEGGTAITLTTTTSVGCFLASGLFATAQPAFFKFNLTMSMGLLINLLGFVFYFSGCMVLNERRILAGYSDLWPWKTVNPSCKAPCRVDVAQKCRTFIGETYAPLFTRSPSFKLAGTTFMLVSVALAVVFVPTIESGMAPTTFLVDSSPLYKTYDDFTALGDGLAGQATTLQIEGLNLTSHATLEQFKADFIDPITARDETLFIACLPLSYLNYRTTTLAKGAATVQPWHDWLAANAVAQSLFGHSYYPVNAAQSGVVPATIECTMTYLSNVVSRNASARIETMNGYYVVTTEANSALAATGTSVRLNSIEWAIMTSLDKHAPWLCWQSIIIAIATVMLILLFTLPLRSAIVSAVNVGLVVFSMMGFMGYANQSYNLLTLSVTAMGPGFCVDYTVEMMHFANLGPRHDRVGVKMMKAMRLCGYDVFHGCVTGMLGVVCLMLTPGEAPRLFSFSTLVMLFYGGVFALWSLPSALTLIDDACSGERCEEEKEEAEEQKTEEEQKEDYHEQL
eukprot:TRINITY_DN67409_c0_g1_i1.p1 TRINITY_DN67409_c0_g1~~TRINITY_DN67409_c0_g1_i1.p1  ORF type:complete len:950 (-),score=157.32 TRINITY_DN67409_c0_g1_i1:216-2807(-)